MVDWPRGEVLACLAGGRAPALIARRQMLPHQPANFFWVVDRLTLDGVIRSDNRGSEYVFPGEIAPPATDPGGPWQANFCPAAIRRSSGLTGLEWQGVERGDPRHGFTAADLLAYVYAVFSAPSYRARYAEQLSADFPRVPLPWSLEAFQGLRRLGHQLIALHLLHADDVERSPTPTAASREEATGGRVAAGFPRLRDGCVWIHAKAAVAEVSEDVWTFHVGAHQVCRKWLRDRRGRRLDPDDLADYRRILHAVQRTQQLLPALDRIVHEQGGWQAAFRKGAFAG
jgi:hypothetical protein